MADRRLDLRRSHHRGGMALQAELVRGVEERLHHQSRSRTLPRQAHERNHDRARRRPPFGGVAPEGGGEFDPGSGGVWPELSGGCHSARAPECSGVFALFHSLPNVVLAKARTHYPREEFGKNSEFGTPASFK